MSDDRNPGQAYREQRFGEPPNARFETDVRFWESAALCLADCVPGRGEEYGVVDLEGTKPDPRLRLTVAVGFVPRDEDAAAELTDLAEGGLMTVETAIVRSRVWWAALEDVGGGLRAHENVLGTRAAPVPVVELNSLWGGLWEFNDDSQAVRGHFILYTGGVRGRWMARARWSAREEMSERDWMSARTRMELTRTPQGLLLGLGGQPG